MKRLGTAITSVGLVAILYGVGSLVYPMIFPSPPIHPKASHDPDGVWQLALMAQRFVIGVCFGAVAIALGEYIRNREKNTKDELPD